MQDTADHTAVVHPFLAAHVSRQMWFDPKPLFIAQPKQVVPHPICLRITQQSNQQPIQPARLLLSVGPSSFSTRLLVR
jgi:hypothetical protein